MARTGTRLHPEHKYTYWDAVIACIIVCIAIAFSLGTSIQKRLVSRAAEGVYTRADVARHDESGDCWLIVDNLVFDLSPESRKHPSLFSCGSDGSANYHRNHGPTIRDRMMAFNIGSLAESERSEQIETESDHADATISPRRELYRDEGTWDPHQLMIVMERDNRSLLAIDGATHEAVGRVYDIGERVHTQVFSPDAQYAYHISRDGWLTKIDLKTLEPVGILRVGADSRGTAMTDSGKYIAIGNYEPRDVVIVAADSMGIVARISLVDTDGDEPIFSRAGGVVEKGEQIIVALKDARSVWVIDTEDRGVGVVRRFWNIGEPGDVLHDAFLTPDGRHFLTAVQGSDRVWVMDTDKLAYVAEVPAGKTPHTGPGAVWGDTVFVPSLGEGVLAAIDTSTWQLKKRIQTAGAGLFVRGYPANPAYPYVWADTAFGKVDQDAVHIIDARTLEIVHTLIPKTGKRAVHPEFTRDGSHVYVAGWGSDAVYVYDARTFERVATIDAFTPSGISNVGLRIEEPGL